MLRMQRPTNSVVPIITVRCSAYQRVAAPQRTRAAESDRTFAVYIAARRCGRFVVVLRARERVLEGFLC